MSFADPFDELDEEIQFLGLDREQARLVRVAGSALIADEAISAFIGRGQFAEARALVRSEDLAEVLPFEMRREAMQRILAAEQRDFEAFLTMIGAELLLV